MEDQEANDRLTYMAPEVRCLQKIRDKGFVDQYRIVNEFLLCLDNQQLYSASQTRVVNFYRFEGISDPEDMSIIYAIETSDGRRGILINAYGLYADDSIGNFINRVQDFQKITRRKWT